KAVIADLRDVSQDQAIDAGLLGSRVLTNVQDSIVLLATSWGKRRVANEEWHYHSPYLSPSGAEWIVQNKARAVGIDHYSIGGSRDPDNSRTHEILLGTGLWVLEDLHFPDEVFAASQPLQLWALP